MRQQGIDTTHHQCMAETLALRVRMDRHREDLGNPSWEPMNLGASNKGTFTIFSKDELRKIPLNLSQRFLKQRYFGDIGLQ